MKSLNVHRINFFKPDPLAVRCISYDRTISRLAVSRADASIEIWDVRKNPYLEKVIPSVPNGSVETLSWCNGRLFSAGLYGYLYEYDLISLSQKYQLLVTTGCPIWCMAVNQQKTCLAIGNEDGHVILHDFTLDGLDFQKKFDKQEGCILCLAWHRNGHVIVTGSQDTIRVWNVETGHVINRIVLGRANKNTPTVVWCISILGDMTIVSGDSCGKTSFWDGNTGTLLSSQAIHKEDVLALCISKNEEEIFTSGVDPIIQMFMQSQSNGMWLKSVQRVVHTHDVRVLQLLDNFLVSGGDDCNLVFTKYPPKTTIKYFPFCQKSYAAVAPLASCILLRYPKYLELWRIERSLSSECCSSQKLLQIKTKSNEVITCSCVSPDARWVVYSSQLQLRLFHITIGEGSLDIPVISKVFLPDEIPDSASIVLFFPQPAKVLLYCEGKFFIIKCGKESANLENMFEEDEEHANQIHLMALADNGLYLACGSHNGNVTIYNLETQKVIDRLPQYKYQPTALQFDPVSSENLIVAYSDRKIIEYNMKRKAYTNWCKKQILQQLQEASCHPIMSIVYIDDNLFLSDENYIYVFNKSKQSKPARKKVKQSKDLSIEYGDNDDYTTIKKYEHISGIYNFFEELVVVQISPRHIEDTLPPPIWKKKFGT